MRSCACASARWTEQRTRRRPTGGQYGGLDAGRDRHVVRVHEATRSHQVAGVDELLARLHLCSVLSVTDHSDERRRRAHRRDRRDAALQDARHRDRRAADQRAAARRVRGAVARRALTGRHGSAHSGVTPCECVEEYVSDFRLGARARAVCGHAGRARGASARACAVRACRGSAARRRDRPAPGGDRARRAAVSSNGARCACGEREDPFSSDCCECLQCERCGARGPLRVQGADAVKPAGWRLVAATPCVG